MERLYGTEKWYKNQFLGRLVTHTHENIDFMNLLAVLIVPFMLSCQNAKGKELRCGFNTQNGSASEMLRVLFSNATLQNLF